MSKTKRRFKALALMACFGMGAACTPANLSTPAASATISSAELVKTTSRTRVTLHSKIELGSAALSGFKKFQNTGGVYGAMYVTEDGDGFSWRSRRFSAHDANIAAKVDCEAFFEQNCVLHSSLGPASGAEGTVFIPDQSGDSWENAVRENQAGHYIAIAASPTGGSGFAWDFSSASDARRAALETCRKNMIEGRTEETNKRIAAANEAAGIYDCYIFGVFR